MSYLSAKKIYPGNFNEPLNGWYKNIDTNDSGSNDASNGGPTSVLANPGWQFYQLRGYVPVTTTGYTSTASVIIPSPYRNDDTRTDITGMVVSADTTRPAYVYRTNISVAQGWGDGRLDQQHLGSELARAPLVRVRALVAPPRAGPLRARDLLRYRADLRRSVQRGDPGARPGRDQPKHRDPTHY